MYMGGDGSSLVLTLICYLDFNLLSLCLQNVKLIVPVVVLMVVLIVIVLGVVYMMYRARYGAFCCINPVSMNYNLSTVYRVVSQVIEAPIA